MARKESSNTPSPRRIHSYKVGDRIIIADSFEQYLNGRTGRIDGCISQDTQQYPVLLDPDARFETENRRQYIKFWYLSLLDEKGNIQNDDLPTNSVFNQGDQVKTVGYQRPPPC